MSDPLAGPVAPTAEAVGRLSPLGVPDVRIGPGFWGDRQALNRSVVLYHCLGWMERLGWVANFWAAAEGRVPGDRRGREFSDSEIYKLLEALSWTGDADEATIGEAIIGLTAPIAAAQEPDGYLNTRFGHQGREARYRDLEWGHELYCYGHLIQAAVARLRTHGEDNLVVVARRAADHVCRVFGPGGRDGVCGHPEIEMALVELYRATGEARYLEQARLFVERRGRPALGDIELGRAYFQDDVPVRAAPVLRGHVVRALYLACGAVDVAVETGDRELLGAVVRQWHRTIATRTYLTGGMGARHEGESFGEDYELPPDRAYAETCAGVASVMLAWRLLLATGNAVYADVIERTLYNLVAGALRLDGRAFFYANPLQVRVPGQPPDEDEVSARVDVELRVPWFQVSCCPTNLARLLASLSGYVATTDPSGIQIHQFVAGSVRAARPARGEAVALRMETGYPWSGDVTVHVEATPASPWRLALRIPAWAGEVELVVGTAEPRRVRRSEQPFGYAGVERVWHPGDVLRLRLPVRPRWRFPDPRAAAVRGCVAVERGPLVYCAERLEGAGGPSLDEVTVDPAAADPVDVTGPPAHPAPVAVGVPTRQPARADQLTLIPYCLWANRGPATMRVWLPSSGAEPQ